MIKNVETWLHWVGALRIADVVIGEDAGIVGFNRLHGKRGTVHNHPEKLDGSSVALLTRRP